MTYVINKSCAGCLDRSCLDVCPCDVILGPVEGQMVIDPEHCIDCGACLPECPVAAIEPDSEASPADIERNSRLSLHLLTGLIRPDGS